MDKKLELAQIKNEYDELKKEYEDKLLYIDKIISQCEELKKYETRKYEKVSSPLFKILYENKIISFPSTNDEEENNGG